MTEGMNVMTVVAGVMASAVSAALAGITFKARLHELHDAVHQTYSARFVRVCKSLN
jgi:hypothetical protein